LEDCRERLTAHRVTAIRLDLAATLLKQADEGLRQKYVAPIRERYLRYADRLEKALGQGVHLDRDLCLRFEVGGALREEKYLSRGQGVLCDLAFRLALLEAVAGEGAIPLVLDDPFAELDAAHLEKAKAMLLSMAKDGQILYLTCHESRALRDEKLPLGD
jgi:DNA repair exonuclease SbcCD ATPase subunit